MLLRRCCPVALLSLFATALLAQLPTTFNTLQSPTTQPSMDLLAVDLNNDGVPDIVQTSVYNQPCTATISLGKGDGTFGPPNTFFLPNTSSQVSTCPVAAGDFNGDGNADLAFAVPGPGDVIVVMLGNGDGTFQAPVSSLVSLPNGAYFIDTIYAADFNYDGRSDLVVQYEYPNPPYQNYVMVMPSDGSGSFGSGKVVFTPAPAGVVAAAFSVGDFDADKNADLAFVSNGSVHVLYGDGKFGFTDTTALVRSASNISAGDLNGDGRTDLFGIDGSQLVTLYAQPGRTFAAYFSSLPASGSLNSGNSCCDSILKMADFNSDGRMDLVGELNYGYPNPKQQLAFFLAGANPGEFTIQIVNMPSHLDNSGVVVGDFNRDTKPDVLIALGDRSPGPAVLATAINSTSGTLWSNCNYPHRGQGIALCAPIAYAPSTVSFAATASTLDPLRKIELWVDGKKIAEQHHTWENWGWFNLNSSFASGTHGGTLFAATVDNALERLDFAFIVGAGPCPAPTAEGIHICKPVAGTTSSPVLVQASATIAGPLARMELWVDGVKKYTETTSTWFSTSVYTPPGNHRFDVFAVNQSGVKWQATAYAATGP